MKTYYLYRHIRLDKNEVFYIGIGTKFLNGRQDETKYRRAYENTYDRRPNRLWCKIYNSCECVVEILMESKSKDFIYEKEKEFIKLYKRIQHGGTLANFTDGGEGNDGQIVSKKTREKMSKNSSFRGKSGTLSYRSRPIYLYSTSGVYMRMFGSLRECANYYKIDHKLIVRIASGKGIQYNNIIFKYEFLGNFIQPVKYKTNLEKTVLWVNDEDIVLYEFSSITEASKFFNLNRNTITNRCKSNKPFASNKTRLIFY